MGVCMMRSANGAEFRAAAPGYVDSLIGVTAPGSFDALEFARAQLHSAARDLEGSDIAPELRVQLGLLAAQVALAERLALGVAAAAADDESEAPPPPESDPLTARVNVGWGREVEWVVWDVDLIVRILQGATSASLDLVRALAAEGGTATVNRLRELTGRETLHHMTQSLNVAGQRETRLPEKRLIQAQRYPHSASKVVAYSFPEGTTPLFAAALERFDAWAISVDG
jgi:hypothetical protein